MSHEMRTPLFGVMGTLNVLNELKLDPQYQEMIRVGQICGEQLLVLINGKLSHSVEFFSKNFFSLFEENFSENLW